MAQTKRRSIDLGHSLFVGRSIGIADTILRGSHSSRKLQCLVYCEGWKMNVVLWVVLDVSAEVVFDLSGRQRIIIDRSVDRVIRFVLVGKSF